jgi:hypothetical protein
MSSQVTQVASARAELLRAYAAQTSPGCTNANVKSDTNFSATTGITERWTLLGNPGDPTRDVNMRFTYRVPRGTRTETMMITLYCK